MKISCNLNALQLELVFIFSAILSLIAFNIVFFVFDISQWWKMILVLSGVTIFVTLTLIFIGNVFNNIKQKRWERRIAKYIEK